VLLRASGLPDITDGLALYWYCSFSTCCLFCPAWYTICCLSASVLIRFPAAAQCAVGQEPVSVSGNSTLCANCSPGMFVAQIFDKTDSSIMQVAITSTVKVYVEGVLIKVPTAKVFFMR
jgi:hypothetical protein